MPSTLVVLDLCSSNRVVNHFILKKDGHKTTSVFYLDTDSLYFEENLWDEQNEAGFLRENLGQGKNEFGMEGTIFALF